MSLNEPHIDTFYEIFKTFLNFHGFTGNDVIIPEKLDINIFNRKVGDELFCTMGTLGIAIILC